MYSYKVAFTRSHSTNTGYWTHTCGNRFYSGQTCPSIDCTDNKRAGYVYHYGEAEVDLIRQKRSSGQNLTDLQQRILKDQDRAC